MNDRHKHLRVLARIAVLVAVGDWLTKAVASRLVGSEPVILSDRLRFAVVHNDGTAFGWSAGTYTWQLNLLFTVGAILLMIPVARDLARIDKSAPRALGFIVGGALGNLASLAIAPPGVVDFISIGVSASSDLVINLADIAAYIGLAMLFRTGFLIVGEIRHTARPDKALVVNHWTTVKKHAGTFVEVEVPLQVALADVRPGTEIAVVRPESVRRTELLDIEVAVADPKVIDIRPHLAAARPPGSGQRAEGLRGD